MKLNGFKERLKVHNEKGIKQNVGRAVGATAITLSMLFGGPVGCSAIPKGEPIDRIAKTPEDIQKLGFKSQEDFYEYKKIKNRISNPDVKREELLVLKARLEEILKNVVKEKAAECLYEQNSEALKEIGMEKIPVHKYEPNEVKVLHIPNDNIQLISFSNPQSTTFDNNGIGNKDYVCANYLGAQNSIDDNISEYIYGIAKLQGKTNPTADDLKEAIARLEKFACYQMVFQDGSFVTYENQEIMEKIDNLIKER